MQFQRGPVGGAILITLFGVLPTTTLAQSVPQPALDACASLSEGAGCSFVTPDGSESGYCATSGSDLACMPDGGGMEVTTTPNDDGEDVLIATTSGSLPDTGQSSCFDNAGSRIGCPAAGDDAYGQDAQYQGNALSYTDNGDGTVSDNVTGLMWQQTIDSNGDGAIAADDKFSYDNAVSYCDALTLAGYDDWWLPDIKQAYSLIHFEGEDVSSYEGSDTSGLIPFIDTDYFDFGYGDTNAGERVIDAQYASSTRYVSTTMNGDETLFGVNFADGRIKGYGLTDPGSGAEKTFYVQCVRGNASYGQNSFSDNGNGTITDAATGLMWSQDDNGSGLDFAGALAWVVQANAENHLGYGDWRLPNVKELQSILDYSRSPDTTGSAAIDPLFNTSAITNEAGAVDYPYYWSNTTHIGYGDIPGANATYLSFGRAMGYMNGSWMDVHGAGAQRSDPKSGDPADYPTGHGPQGDAIRIYNYVRLVRDAGVESVETTPDGEQNGNEGDDETAAQGGSQCALYGGSGLTLPCIDVMGAVYSVELTLTSGSPLRFTADLNTLQSVSDGAGAECAAYGEGGGSGLRLPCVEVSGTRYWAEMEPTEEGNGLEFEVVDFGAN